MSVDVRIPTDLWEEDEEGVITTWLTDDGATVGKGDIIATVMVKKVQFDIHAPAGGKLTMLKKADDVIRKGDVIGRIE
jgi:pyruvate/2-oxoglutarate dehydrogenase complex dihydrolipoamide acyltransferase (E2) component